MNLKRELTRPECDHFRKECNFTDDERAVFDLRVTGRSIVTISLALNMSETTVNRRLRDIKRKIEKVTGN